jgi:hypothetical protein
MVRDATRNLSRWLLAAGLLALLAIPMLTLWNIAVTPLQPKLAVRFGPRLAGYVPPVKWPDSWRELRDQSWQKAIGESANRANPFMPLFVRINNELRYALFGYVSVPDVIEGRRHQLVETRYLSEYCARTAAEAERNAKAFVPLLRDVQTYYRSRGKVFVYVITPSKVAHQPDDFVDLIDCPNSERDRRDYLAAFVAPLREAGIAVVDTASLIHGRQDKYDVPLFPQGGIHWNWLGAGIGAQAVVDEINRQAGRVVLPPFAFSYTIAEKPRGTDRDLVDLMNVFFPPLGYRTPEVAFQPSISCEQNPARGVNAVIVGDSFIDLLGQVLTNAGCMSGLKNYRYLWLANFRNSVDGLSPQGLQPILDADVAILEENEAWVSGGPFSVELHNLLTGK